LSYIGRLLIDKLPASSDSTSQSSTPTDTSTDNGSGLSKGAQAGIGVGAAAGGTTIIIIIVLYIRNKKFRDQVNNFFNNLTNINGDHNKVDQAMGTWKC
jgi:hypothetical protein